MNEQLTINIGHDHKANVFKKLRELYGPNANIQEGYLRLQNDLTPGQPSFQLSVVADSRVPSSRISEYLTTNDNFFVTGMSVAIFKNRSALPSTFDKEGNAQLWQYPDMNFFNYNPTPLVNVSEWESLEAVYNGKYGIKSDTSELIYEAPLQAFRAAPVTQYQSLLFPNQPSHGQFHQDFIQNVYNPFVFEGKKQTDITVTFAPNADLTYVAGDPTIGTNKFVMFMYGWRIRNVSEAVSIDELIRRGAITQGKLNM